MAIARFTDTPVVCAVNEIGDSSLNFVVLCHLNGMKDRVKVTHLLNTAINQVFNEASISIPFRQRDVPVYSSAVKRD